MTETSQALAHHIRPAHAQPEGAIVLLHGRGTSEHDLVPLLDALDPERRLVGITPRGPLSLPPGGSHWYKVQQIGYPDAETFHHSFAQLSAWLDEMQTSLDVPPARTVLGGFSQGAVMSYALSLGANRPRPAALIALSGFIPTVAGLDFDLKACVDLPVAIGHGTLDPVIGIEWGRQAKDTLGQAGLDVHYRESAIPHTVDPSFVEELSTWLKAAVPQPK
jgi:phospholipase/carboxylesterase